MLRRILLTSSVLAFGLHCLATEIMYEKDVPDYGIGVVKVDESTWKSKNMEFPGYPRPAPETDRIWSGGDFFTDEYGKPCVFTEDWIKEHGYSGGGEYTIDAGALTFTTGPKGFFFGFGPEPGKNDRPALRFGFDWGRQRKDNYRLRMEIEQSVDETEWEFVTSEFKSYDGNPSRFKVKGKGPQAFEQDIGLVREAMNRFDVGFKFTCKTPGATVKVKSMKIAPSSAEVFFRKKFDLKDTPVMAHCSFTAPETYELYVNGKKVDTGTDIYPCGILRTLDLKPYLVKGENTIAFVKQFLNWEKWGSRPAWLFEGVAVDREGALTRILGDASWKCSLKRTEGWMNPAFDDSSWAKPELNDNFLTSEMPKGAKAFTGINPRHMGMLDAAPVGRPYPIFELQEAPAFKVRLPAGAKGKYDVTLDVFKGGTTTLVESVKAPAPIEEGDLITFHFELKTREVGPYRLMWKLCDKAGTAVETRREEAVIVGPVPQEELTPAAFDAEFEKRLTLVTKIDCTAPVADDGEFIDHAGMYNAPAVNKGKVVSQDGMSYRETGPGRWDYFAYRVHLKERGEPYLAEIIVPDNRDRYIYSGIAEHYPIGFCNNFPDGHRGWYTSTGTCYTGLRYPLTCKKRKLRYIFFPSSAGSSIVVMSGMAGYPAAACEINIYKVEGGLPALKVTDSDRMFGSHNERVSVMTLTLGMCEQPLMHDKRIRLGLHQDAYLQWYKTLERKIKLLRFQGYNMAVEGMYMYTEGEHPSRTHNSNIADQDFDPAVLMIKMYNHNKIKCLLGFEYIASPQVYNEGKGGISDRRVWQGEASTRLVDRHGRQLVGYSNNGFNFLDPDISRIMLDCLSEIYQRYEGVGAVAGLFVVNGQWWLPTFNTRCYPELDDLEVGFDDCAVGLFEKETGVKLGIDPKDAKRFQKRYEAITARHLPLWINWRAKKTQEFYQKMAQCVQGGKSKWHLYHLACVDIAQNSPFMDKNSTRDTRDSYMEKRYKETGLPLEIYKNSPNTSLALSLQYWAKFGSPLENYDYVYGWNGNPGSKKVINDMGCVYLGTASGLDEVDSPAPAAKRWLFDNTARGVFTPRGVEDNAMNEFVEATMVDKVPKVIFDQWLDCNMETGFGAQLRRFAQSFYATPDVVFTELPRGDVKGLFAQSAPMKDGVCLRLVNNTPFPVDGHFTASAKNVKDMVNSTDIAPGFLSGGAYSVTFKPNEIKLFLLSGLDGAVQCEFSYPQDVAADITKQASFILQEDFCLRKVPGDMIARLFKERERGDAFALYNLLNDFEVHSNVKTAKSCIKAIENQQSFLDDLAKGCARINCGCASTYTDTKGNRWLSDQDFKDCGAYGSTGASWVDRGNLDIKNTVAPRVYQTEVYGGHVVYKLPVPNGNYHVRLHFAETFINNNLPGMRLINVKVNDRVIPDKIDPLQLAGAFATPYVLELKDFSVHDGLLVVDLTGNVEINGIEVEKAP